MKKSIIALAVAGALTAPLAQADATLYGVAQFRLIDEDTKSLNADMAKTRLGVKGTVDNDIEGLTTGFQFEWEFSGADANDSDGVSEVRKSNVYFKGDFGEVKFGKQNNPFGVVQKADVLGYNSNYFSVVNDRVESAIAYYSPEVAGFTFAGSIIADGSAEDGAAATAGTDTTLSGAPTFGTDATDGSEDVDGYNMVVSGDIMGLSVALGYEAVSTDVKNGDSSTVGLGLGYAAGPFAANLEYDIVDHDSAAARKLSSAATTVTGEDVDHLELALAYTAGKATFTYQYEQLEYELATDDSVKSKKNAVRVDYSLGGSAGVALEIAEFNDEAERDIGANDAVVLEYTLSF